MKYLLFELGADCYAVPVEAVSQIVELQAVASEIAQARVVLQCHVEIGARRPTGRHAVESGDDRLERAQHVIECAVLQHQEHDVTEGIGGRGRSPRPRRSRASSSHGGGPRAIVGAGERCAQRRKRMYRFSGVASTPV